MTLPSRGISDIQEQARGNDMKCGMKKGGKMGGKMGPKNMSAKSTKISMRKPMDEMSVGPTKSRGSVPGYAKGGSIDGVAKKGKTKGRVI
jgi:hypothetical protein